MDEAGVDGVHRHVTTPVRPTRPAHFRWTFAIASSGTVHTIREVAVVLGVALLGVVFAASGGYSSSRAFIPGFVPAMWMGAALAAVGAVVAWALPRAK